MEKQKIKKIKRETFYILKLYLTEKITCEIYYPEDMLEDIMEEMNKIGDFDLWLGNWQDGTFEWHFEKYEEHLFSGTTGITIPKSKIIAYEWLEK